ncbi:hypothetical protein Tco_1077745 [Tanacetum coccineum]
MIGCKVMRILASVEIEIILILGLPCCLSNSSMRCLENVSEIITGSDVDWLMLMSTPVFVDPKISTQADRAQSSRVPVPLPEDPYEAIRQAYLVGTDTDTPPISHVAESGGSDTSGARSTSSDSTAPLSPDHPLTHTTPTLVPILHRTVRMAVCVPPKMSSGLSASMAEVAAMSDSAFRKRFRSYYKSSQSSSTPDLPLRKRYQDSDNVGEDTEDEGPTAKDEDPPTGDEGLAVGDEGPGMGVERLSLGGYEAIPRGQQRATPVTETAMGEPLGLGYRALRRQEIALGEGRMPSVFEVGQSSRSVPESKRPKIVLALQQPTLTTWMNPEDGIVYIDVLAYPPPAPPAQTPPSPEWSSALPATVETEGFLTELGEVRDEIFSQRYRFRSLEHDQERVVLTFGAIWRPVLALKSWAGQTDAQRAALWHSISDTQGENWEL